MLSNRPIAVPTLPHARDARGRLDLRKLPAEDRAGDWYSRAMRSYRLRERQAELDAAWDRALREGQPLGPVQSRGGLGPRTAANALDAEAETWLILWDRLGCAFDVSPYSRTLSYKIPREAQAEAGPLIHWLDAAEPRIPGITARVLEMAFNFDALEHVIAEARAKAGKGRAG